MPASFGNSVFNFLMNFHTVSHGVSLAIIPLSTSLCLWMSSESLLDSIYGWIMCCHLFWQSLFPIGEFNAFTGSSNDKKRLVSLCSLFSMCLRALFHPHFLHYFLFQVIFCSEMFKFLSHFHVVTVASPCNSLSCSSLSLELVPAEV